METKAKILNSAFELFAKKGISFTLAEVAKQVGIRKASIYAHYESKEILLNEVIEKEMKEYFFEINPDNDNLEKIFYGILKYYNKSHSTLLFWKRLLLLPPESIDESIIKKIHHLTDERFQKVKEIIEIETQRKNLKHNSVESICIMFFSLIQGLLSSELIYHPSNIKEHHDIIWHQFWTSIKY